MEKLNSGFGLLLEPKPVRDYDFEICCGSGLIPIDELPDEYILPEDRIPSVHNQYQTMQCVSFAMCQCAESAHKEFFNEEVHYSEQFNYARNECRNGYTGEGMYTSSAMKGSVKIGFVPTSVFDYSGVDVPEILDIANSRDDLLPIGQQMKPSAYSSISNYALESKKWDAVRQAIYTYKRPIVIASSKYFGGGHAVIAIGWTTKKGKTTGKYLHFQNSWGKEYGENGRSRIPLSYVNDMYVFHWDDIKLPFVDVNKDDWYHKEVLQAYCSGLISGTSSTTFDPNSNIIRADVAVILDRYINKSIQSVNAFIKTMQDKGHTDIDLISLESSTELPFKDVNRDSYYYDAVTMAYSNFLMNGIDDEVFDPSGTVTRAMIATIAVRTLEFTMRNLAIEVAPNMNYAEFSDVSEDKWYYHYIKDANCYGLVNGDGDLYRPDDSVTRAEATAIFNRLFKWNDKLFHQFLQ